MTYSCFDEARMLNAQERDFADIYPMGTGIVAFSVAKKFAVCDLNGAVWPIAGKKPFLIVDDAALFDPQIPAFGANAGAIVVGNAGAREGEIADRDVVPASDEQRFALAGLVGNDGAGAAAFDGQMVHRPDRAVKVFAAVDDDGVTRARDGGGLARCLEVAARSDFKRPGGGYAGKTHQADEGEGRPNGGEAGAMAWIHGARGRDHRSIPELHPAGRGQWKGRLPPPTEAALDRHPTPPGRWLP